VKTAWITPSEAESLLVAAGIVESAPADLEDVIQAAISEWERETGWTPFLAETVDSTRRYDPTGSILRFHNGYISVASVTASDTALVEGDDYELWPYDARQRYQPYTELRFRYRLGGPPRSVEITGKRGYNDTIDEVAWLAVYMRVASVVARRTYGAVGPTSEIKEGPVAYKFGAGRATPDQLDSEFRRRVALFKRIEI
jgi:hypothetical protein